ncbi:MAG: DegQ family serine endoprotease [Pseudomonadales bacterium]
MKQHLRFVSVTAMLILALGYSAVYASPQELSPSTHPSGSMQGMPSFADVVRKVSPAVVNIAVSKKVDVLPTMGSGRIPPSFRGSPLEEFFGRFNGPDQPRERAPLKGLGSGFILDAAGYVVTNHHVIAGADEITVTLDDGDKFDAVLVGEDPKTDLALLKITSDGALPHVALDNSDNIRVGDWVLAIGNPFGLGGTATAGIVSAKSRDIQAGPYDDYLQIDAPINSGNSGGPVFDTQGRVIGVNTAIYSPNGGSVGIGFAIPASQVATIIKDLKQQGHVTRGWLGVQIQPLDAELAESLGLASNNGALIAGVDHDSPASRAGFQPGDVVTKFDNETVDSPKDLGRHVAATVPGAPAKVTLWRQGEQTSLTVQMGEMPGAPAIAARPAENQGRAYDDMGLSLALLSEQLRQQYDIPEDAFGLLVTQVKPDSTAHERGIRAGDVISTVNGHSVETLEDMNAALKGARTAHKPALMLVRRGDGQRFVALALA